MRSGYTLVQNGRLRYKTGAKTRPGRSDTQRATAARETTYGSSPMASRRQVDTEHRQAPINTKSIRLQAWKRSYTGEWRRITMPSLRISTRFLHGSCSGVPLLINSSRAQAIRALTVADHEGQLLPAYRSRDKHLEQRTSHTKPCRDR